MLTNLLQFFQRKEPVVQSKETIIYTEEQLMARLRFFIGICLALTLTGIVFVVLYSLIFVTQPLNAISPMDQKFFELIIPIATFLTGTLSGIMLAGKDDKPKLPTPPAATLPPPSGMLSGGIQPAGPAPIAPKPVVPPVASVPVVTPKVVIPPIIKPPGV
jgi:hypothetical protein